MIMLICRTARNEPSSPSDVMGWSRRGDLAGWGLLDGGRIQGERSKAHELGGALQAVQQKSKGWLLLYDWYNGLTGDDGEIYHSEWRIDEDGHRWFNPHFPECEIRRIYLGLSGISCAAERVN